MPEPRVAVVVLNWHGREDTLECLRAVGRLSYANRFAICVDNGCCELSSADVSQLAGGGDYVRSDVNLGFTGGSNLAMRGALGGGADYVWFLNNDARPEPASLTELVSVARQAPGAAIVGAKILQWSDPRRIDSIALDVNLHTGRVYLQGHDQIDQGQYDTWGSVRAVTGCAMLVSRPACEELHGFDDAFFAYLEDADLCLRAHAAGLRVAVAPRSRVLHNRPSARQPRQSLSSLYYTTRNHLLLMQRHAVGGRVRRLTRSATVVALNIAYAARGAGAARRARLRAVGRGVRDYAQGIVGPGPDFEGNEPGKLVDKPRAA